MISNARVSQEVIEVLKADTVTVRVSQEILEPLASRVPTARVSQEVIEPLAARTPTARVSQIVQEVLASKHFNIRASQIVVEVLCAFVRINMPALYPDLPGLGYSQFWTPKFFNQSEQASGGANIDAALSATPIHEFELTYDFLRDSGAFMASSPEYRIFMAFWLAMGGQVGRFLYKNTDDYNVENQFIATTDGVASVFGPLVRTYGYGGNNQTEPVGYVDMTQPFNVYLGGVKQGASSYQVIQTTPMNQQLKFFNTPSADLDITVDMYYRYYCKFTEDSMSFEKIMNNLIQIKKLTIRSCKAGT